MYRKRVLSKLDAAGRLLETAIRLYFNAGDPVSIHILAARAHGLISRLNENNTVPLDREDFPMTDGLKARFRTAILENEDPFGNTASDADGRFEIDPEIAPFFIFDAIANHQALGGKIHTHFSAFRGWFCAQYMDAFNFMEEDRAYLVRMKNRYSEDRATYFTEMMYAGGE